MSMLLSSYMVIAEYRVGILPIASVTSPVSGYLAAGETFAVQRVFVDTSDNRKYLQLANGQGWVPECSRKDATRPVVVEVGAEPAEDVAMMQASSSTIPEEPNEDASGAKQSKIRDCGPELSQKLQGQLRKTRMCAYWSKGTCNHGENCAFAHSEDEIHKKPNLAKTRMCEAFQQGKCTDPDCNFAHDEEEFRPAELFHKTQMCKWAQMNQCRNGAKCRFAHSASELKPVEDTPDKTNGISADHSSGVTPVSSNNKNTASVEGPMKMMFPPGGKVNPVSLSAPPGLVAEPQQNLEFLKATVSTLMMQCNALQKQVETLSVPAGKTPLKAAAKPFVPLNSDAKPFVPAARVASAEQEETSDKKKLTSWQ